MKASTLWTREELIVVLNLYWKIPYNRISGTSNAEIKTMSMVLGRTPAAIAYKLMNFTSLDQERQKKGNKGKDSAGKLDEIIWSQYYNKWEELAMDSAKLLCKFRNLPIEKIFDIEEDMSSLVGKEKNLLVKTRVNQYDFRHRILASYNEKCCITGIDIPKLLVASHIIPWSKNEKERLNPKNGLCLNTLHDKAFDQGLLTVLPEYKVKLSNQILEKKNDHFFKEFFLQFDKKLINLPERYLPDTNFLIWHNQNIFEKHEKRI